MGRFTVGTELGFLNTNFFCEGLAKGAVKDVCWSAFRAATVEQHIGCSSLRGEKITLRVQDMTHWDKLCDH